MKTKRAPGTGTINHAGYIFRTIGSWGKKYSGGIRKFEHVLVAEKALGRSLRNGECVHHWNEDKQDNRPSNLLICPTRAYHLLIHQRTRAYDACGHADWLKCPYCKQYDAPENMSFRPRGKGRPGQLQWTHSRCQVEDITRRKRAKAAKASLTASSHSTAPPRHP
jgi:hypothetical protein